MVEDAEYRCFVGSLASATDDHSLEQAFRPYGEIVESRVVRDQETGTSFGFGFGFVTFTREQFMRDAIKGMNNQNLDGRNIIVIEAQSLGSDRGDNYGYRGDGNCSGRFRDGGRGGGGRYRSGGRGGYGIGGYSSNGGSSSNSNWKE